MSKSSNQPKVRERYHGFTLPVKKPSDGYFIAKREVQDMLEHIRDLYVAQQQTAILRDDLDTANHYKILANELEKLRNYVRNSMLWNTERGK